MTNPYGMPGYSVQEVADKLANNHNFVLIDVRETHELALAKMKTAYLHLPLSQLATRRLNALPPEVTDNKDVEIIVMCHHGNRSAQVTAWLRQEGWTQVFNMDGGIDAYAITVDFTIGRY